MTVEDSIRRNRVWLRPHFLPAFAQLELPVDVAIEAVRSAAKEREEEGGDVESFATEDEALRVWHYLFRAAENLPDSEAA